MNIGIDIRPLMNKQRTGVGEYTYELLSSVFRNTDLNQYFLFYNSYKDVSENIPKWKYDNVHYVCTRMPNKLFSLLTWLGFIRLDKLVLRHLERSSIAMRVESKDEVKSMDYFFAPNINFLSLSRKTKLILTVHDLSFEILPECYTFKRRLWHKVLRPKKLCKRADIILTPSENTKRDIVREWGIEDSKIKVLYPGLCSHITYHISHITDRENNAVKQKYSLPEKYILYLGAIEPRKNILGIIYAYKKSSLLGDGYMLIIAGASGWKNEEVFKTIENTAGVKYIGYVDDEDKTALYKGASLFVFPSLYEGFGLPVLEALACEISVITSDRSSLSEVFGDYVTLVNPNNVSEISRAMREVLGGKRESVKIDLEKFDWSNVVKEFFCIIYTDNG
ncbi:glycosyltransferase family 4 protein [Patescibacteria group bacterium]|nr:glycosyltransferase family 4 protein [Patescibacteria group bacterium]